jgi:mRNA interferase RelE/StbE
MIYTIIYSPLADKQLGKLDKNVKQRIISTLERCKARPYYHAIKVEGSPYFRVRAGDYRVIIDIQDDRLVVLVVEVGHRSTVYRFYEEKAKYRAESRKKIMRRAIG